VASGSGVYFSAEEPIDELHYRLEQISKYLIGGKAQRNRLGLVSHADKDSVLARPDREGIPRPTPLFNALGNIMIERCASLLVLDAAADVFGGNENDRAQVRSFVRLLRGLGIKANCAILLLAHPSVDGLRTGRGYSGSTHWNNAVRSRMYFTTPTSKDGEEPDPDLRVLELVKSNRARRGEKIPLRWRDGYFKVEHGGAAASAFALGQAKIAFIELLRRYTAQGRRVSHKAGPTYAPRQFATDPDSKGIDSKTFRRAMDALFSEDRLRAEENGPLSKRRSFLIEAHLK
jgi:RecA-family ATPase